MNKTNSIQCVLMALVMVLWMGVIPSQGQPSVVQDILGEAFSLSAKEQTQVNKDIEAVLKENGPAGKPVQVAQEKDAGQPVEMNTPEAPAAPAAPAQPAAATAEPVLEAQPMTADGVIPSIVFKGDILDFLRFISITCNANIIPTRQVSGQISVHLFDVTCDQVLEAVLVPNGFAYEKKNSFIYVYTAKEYQTIQEAQRKTVSKVFRLNYLKTKDAQTLISKLLSNAGSIMITPDLDDTEKTGENWAGSNSMIVIDYPEYIEEIGKTIRELDVRPPQILVEATILVVTLDDKDEMGVDFKVLGGVDFQATGGSVNSVPTGDVALKGTTGSGGTGFAGSVAASGLNIGIVKDNIGLFIRAIESTNDAITLGNPKVLTLNRQPAEVRVGRDEGYITTETSSTTTTQSVQMLETGTILKFIPFVMDDGYIRMELHPEDSSGQVVVKGQFALPEKTTTEVNTNVLVKDGHTIVIGGLFREKTTLNKSQVPLLGNIPLLGALFRSKIDSNVKEEVIFLITPHILKEQNDYAAAEVIRADIESQLMGMREGMQWHSRDRLAAAFYHQAIKDRDAGKLKAALWNADQAVQTSPGLMDAIILRDGLRSDHLYQAEMGNMHYFMQNLLEKEQ